MCVCVHTYVCKMCLSDLYGSAGTILHSSGTTHMEVRACPLALSCFPSPLSSALLPLLWQTSMSVQKALIAAPITASTRRVATGAPAQHSSSSLETD